MRTFRVFLSMIAAMLPMMNGCTSIGEIVKTDVEEQREVARHAQTETISHDDIAGLPEPVQRYLKYAQVLGKQRIRCVRIQGEALFRPKQDDDWKSLKAEMYYTTDPPSFVWYGRIKGPFFISIKAREKYMNGKGSFLGKVWPFFTLGKLEGYVMDHDHLMRYLNEMVWFPTAYVNNYISWEAIDSSSARVTISHGGLVHSAIVTFNEKGEMIKFVGKKHLDVDGSLPVDADKKHVVWTWTVTMRDYKEIHGFKVPTGGDAIFTTHSGDFHYIKQLRVTDLEYCNLSVY